MKRVLLVALGLWLTAVAYAQQNIVGTGIFGDVKVASGGGCSDSTTILARLSGSENTSAYQTFICGVATDGMSFLTSGLWDAALILGTDSAADAGVNLVGSTFYNKSGGTRPFVLSTSAPAFSANHGYTGADASSTVYIDTGYSFNLTGNNGGVNSLHVSLWSNSNPTTTSSGGSCIGFSATGSTTRIFPKYSDGNYYGDANDGSNIGGVGVATGVGFYMASRTNSTTVGSYKNGSPITGSPFTNSAGSTGSTTTFAVLADHDATTGFTFGCGNQVSLYTIGAGLTATQASNFYSRVNTLAGAIGW